MTVISRLLTCALVLAIPLSVTDANPQSQAPAAKSATKSDEPPGARIEFVNGFPELYVDGQPFFVHAAGFPYYGVPRDLWAASLDRCVELGINTITLRIPWNWHEPSENEFDFDGHTNPRRDLRGLIELISARKLKMIINAGPANAPDLRGAGYPDWLLARPEYATANMVRLIGAPIPSLPVSDALAKEESAWFSALAKELSASLNARPRSADRSSEKSDTSVSPLLYVTLDSTSQRAGDNSAWMKSIELFREAFLAAGIDKNFLLIDPDVETAIAPRGPGDSAGVAARWPGVLAAVRDLGVAPAAPAAQITPADLEAINWISQQLRLQPRWPPMVADLTSKPEVDVAGNAATAARNDLLVSSRAFLAQGIAGISYSNFQVTLTPPGYEIANIAAPVSESLDVAANPLPPAEAVRRNGGLVRRSGFFLASAHRRTILGIVDWRSQLSTTQSDSALQTAIASFDTAARKIERAATLADIPVDLVDADRQPLLFLLHDTVLLLISPPELRGRTFLSEKSQQALLQFVDRGGSLVCIPELPPDTQIATAARNSEISKLDDATSESSLGRGRIVVSTSDFYSWVRLADTPGESRKRSEASQAIAQLDKLMLAEHARSPVLRSASPADSLAVAELLPNIMETAFGITASSCRAGHRCAEGLLTVGNASDSPATDILRILPPTTNHRTATDDDYAALPIEVPPREALVLPLDTSLCIDEKAGEDCEDRVIAAGAELHKIAREGKTLELTFLAPANATVLLHLAEPPHHVDLLERSVEGHYAVNTKVFTMQIPRGAAPGYERLVKLQMPYTPHVPELPKPDSNKRHDYSAAILNDVRTPAPAGGWLPSFPALIALDAGRNGRIVLNIKNAGDSWFTVKAEVGGAAQGTNSIRVENAANNIESVDVSPGDGSAPDSDGLLRGELRLSNKDHSIAIPLRFYESPESGKAARYRFDFERSGAPDWVLENTSMRIVAAPAKGGRIQSIARRNPTSSVTSPIGAMLDYFRIAGAPEPVRATLNTPFDAHWIEDSASPGITMSAQLPDGLPFSGALEKTVRISGDRKIDVAYQAKLAEQSASSPSMITAFGVAATDAGEQGTQFCWTEDSSASASPKADEKRTTADAGAPRHCEAFHANAADIRVPENVRSLEVRNQGQPALTMEWTYGSVSIKQSATSAELRLEFTLSSDTPTQPTVSYTLAPGGI